MTVNCYLVWDEVSREATLFDTGWNAEPILALIAENQLQLKHIFLTHTHEDHIAALGRSGKSSPKVRLHSGSKHAPPEQRIRGNDFVHLGSCGSRTGIAGHAEEGVTYVVGNCRRTRRMWPSWRCDFCGLHGHGQSVLDLRSKKFANRSSHCAADTLLCPGHGP